MGYRRVLRAALCILVTSASGATRVEAQEATGAGYPASLVQGRRVSAQGSTGEVASGELLWVSADSLWLLARQPWDVVAVPLEGVRSVRVPRGPGAGRVLLWTLTGMAVTGGALAAACGSVEDASCGAVFPSVALTWGLVGGLAAMRVEKERRLTLEPRPEVLRPYARFPQGPPPGLRRFASPPPGSGGAHPG